MVIGGLCGHDAPLEVAPGGIAGRGVFATGPQNQWLCEYKGIVYPRREMDTRTVRGATSLHPVTQSAVTLMLTWELHFGKERRGELGYELIQPVVSLVVCRE